MTRIRHAAFDADAFEWEGVTARAYKDDPGSARGMAWQGLTRHTLVRAPEAGVSFEVRYFEIAPGGFSSLEKHEHVHVVVAARGSGRALVGDTVVELAAMDIVETPPWAPHRWINTGDEPFGFLCTVEGERDKPQPVSDAEWEALLSDPRTAPFVH
ncbi:cupin domain-containing protein [Candidatus Solirubrobacter pratensis]|uniref:cupin domain-containing protein n=1 Tax=Candidatus Solirubrobacter pratensis TaxID=1298857 RepID=UPI000407D3D8|nr:cupin domain-containing protein [Candidatus Solirubrobacter pratensis]